MTPTTTTAVQTLATLRVKQQGMIVALNAEAKETSKLLALGLLPGMVLTVLQTQPSVVFAVGYSQFAVDHNLAGKIQVTLL